MINREMLKIKDHIHVKHLFSALNVIIVLVCSILTLYQCSQSFVQFFAKETRVIITVLSTRDTTFMGLTICPRFEESYNKLKKLGIYQADYMNGEWFLPSSLNSTNSTFDIGDGFQIFRQVTFNLSEIMTVINISTSDPNNATITISFDKTLDTGVAKWSEIFYYVYGRCYSMHISDEVAKKEVTSLVIVSKMGLDVSMHHPGQFINTDSKTRMYGLLGRTITVDVTYEILVNTLENSHGSFPCNSTVDCTYDECIINRISNDMLEEFGCLVPFLPPANGTKVCRFDYSNKTGFDQQKKVIDRYNFLISSGQRSMCPAPCSTMDVFVGLPFSMDYNSNEAYLKLNIKTTTKQKKTVFDYTLVDMWADIGGYSGLLLGTSVVHLLKLVDWIHFRVTRSC